MIKLKATFVIVSQRKRDCLTVKDTNEKKKKLLNKPLLNKKKVTYNVNDNLNNISLHSFA